METEETCNALDKYTDLNTKTIFIKQIRTVLVIKIIVEKTSADGHCIVHALMKSLKTYADISLLLDDVKGCLFTV